MQWVDGEAVAVNETTSEVHYLNPQSALIYALLLEFGMPEAVDEACARIQGPREEIRAQIDHLIETFREKGLLAAEDEG